MSANPCQEGIFTLEDKFIEIYVTIQTMNPIVSLPTHVALDAIRKKHKLALMLLHGSHVRGFVHPKSDVDIAVVRNMRSESLNLLELISDLVQAFGSNHIDVADITHADPLLLYAVTLHGKLISGKEKDFQTLRQKAFHRYIDYLPYLKKEKSFVQNQLQHYVAA